MAEYHLAMYSIRLYCHCIEVVMRAVILTAPGNNLNPRRACPERGRNSFPPIGRWSIKCRSLKEEDGGEFMSRRDVEEKRCSTYIVSGESIESNSPVGRETTAHMNGGVQERGTESDQVCQPGRSSENLWSSWSWALGKISPQTLTRLSPSPSPSPLLEVLEEMREKYEAFF